LTIVWQTTLDALFGYGIGDLDMVITDDMINVFQIESQACPNDTTSVSIYGQKGDGPMGDRTTRIATLQTIFNDIKEQ
jgi:hypothetical protein